MVQSNSLAVGAENDVEVEMVDVSLRNDNEAEDVREGLVVVNPAAINNGNNAGLSRQSQSLKSVDLEDRMKEDELEEQGTILKEPSGEEKTSIKNRVKGIGLIMICILTSVLQGAITKHLKDIPTGELIIVTCTYALLLFFVLVTFQGISLTKFPLKKLLFFRVMFSVVVRLAKIWSYQNLPLGDATALIFASPVFACILGRIFLKEKLTLPQIIAMVLGMFGIVMIAKPTFLFPGDADKAAPWYYNLVPIIGAVNMAAAYTVQRKIGKGVNYVTVSVFMAFAGNLGGLGFQTVSGDPYINPACYTPRFLMLLTGFLNVIGVLALNMGLSYEKSATVSLMRNFDTVLAFLVQVVVFSERAEVLSLAGTGLIIVGTLVLTLSKLFDVSCGVSI